MPDPIAAAGLSSLGPARLTAPAGRPGFAEGRDFADLLRSQLAEVSRMQAEADEGIESLVTGRSDNITEVFTAARKAEVAFSLLMEIRNKLVNAYDELKQLRV